MALHGNQEKYDRNGDGKLSGLEYSRWYYGRYGHDMELEARRTVITVTDSGRSEAPSKKKNFDIVAAVERINRLSELAGEEVDTGEYDSFEGIESMERAELERFYKESAKLYDELLSADPEDGNSDEYRLWDMLMDRLVAMTDAADYRLHPEKL